MAQTASADLERRVALLEGWKESQEPFVLSLKDDIREVQQRLTALQSHMDHRFSDMENATAELARRMDAQREELKNDIAELRTELKSDIAGLRSELKGEMARLVQRMDTQTRWIVGVQFLTLLTLIAALLRLAH
jgi:peptidoglycan hydrolase CwlO-like protein